MRKREHVRERESMRERERTEQYESMREREGASVGERECVCEREHAKKKAEHAIESDRSLCWRAFSNDTARYIKTPTYAVIRQHTSAERDRS